MSLTSAHGQLINSYFNQVHVLIFICFDITLHLLVYGYVVERLILPVGNRVTCMFTRVALHEHGLNASVRCIFLVLHTGNSLFHMIVVVREGKYLSCGLLGALGEGSLTSESQNPTV